MSELRNPVLHVRAPDPTGYTDDEITRFNSNHDRCYGFSCATPGIYTSARFPESVPAPPDFDRLLHPDDLTALVWAWHARMRGELNPS